MSGAKNDEECEQAVAGLQSHQAKLREVIAQSGRCAKEAVFYLDRNNLLALYRGYHDRIAGPTMLSVLPSPGPETLVCKSPGEAVKDGATFAACGSIPPAPELASMGLSPSNRLTAVGALNNRVLLDEIAASGDYHMSSVAKLRLILIDPALISELGGTLQLMARPVTSSATYRLHRPSDNPFNQGPHIPGQHVSRPPPTGFEKGTFTSKGLVVEVYKRSRLLFRRSFSRTPPNTMSQRSVNVTSQVRYDEFCSDLLGQLDETAAARIKSATTSPCLRDAERSPAAATSRFERPGLRPAPAPVPIQPQG